jgi:hypothetical protein
MSAFGASFLVPMGAASAASKAAEREMLRARMDSEADLLSALVRVHGDSAGHTRYWYSDITRYAVIGREAIPLFSQVGLQAARYHVAGDDVSVTIRLCGYFLTTEGRTLITTYNNPFSNQINTVPIFRSGPAQIRWSKGSFVPPDGLPFELRQSIENVRIAGDQVWFDWDISSDQKWGTHRDMLTFNASLDDLLNPGLTSVPATSSFNDVLSWFDFMDMPMEQYPGVCLGRGVGAKLDGAEELPAYLLKLVEQHDPEMIHDVERWSAPPGRIRGA